MTCRGSSGGSTTWRGSAWTRSGCRRSTRRRCATWATTSLTTRASTPCSARSRTSTAWSRPPASAACGVLLDVVPCHTSIEHPWFTEHRDWYIWRDEPNNWLSAFGGSAWSELGGRYYLHSFYPEQPDLDWRNPEVVAAMQDGLRFWVERGAAGYRVDAIDRLLKDPRAARRPARDRGVRAAAERAGGEARAHELAQRAGHARGAGADPRGGGRPRADRRGLPAERAVAAVPRVARRRVCLRAAALRVGRGGCARPSTPPRAAPGAAWVLSNHDFGRLVTRFGAENARSAALMLLTLPGTGVPLPGRRDRAGRRPGRRARVRPRRARPLSPPDAVGRLAVWRLHDRRGLAAAGGSRGHERRGAARRPGIDALARARPARRAARARRGIRAARRRSAACSRTGAASTRSPSTRPPRSGRRRPPASVVLETRPGALDAGVLAPSSARDDDGDLAPS